MSSIVGQSTTGPIDAAGQGGMAGAPHTAAHPVGESCRISALDSVRGLALLGILLVNINFFAAPFGEAIRHIPPEGATALDAAAFYFTKTFCESRFYPLFSLLFGMGLVLQMRSVEGAGGRLGALYSRRLLFLMALGACHALFLWYGDILLIYGTFGWALLLMRRARPRSLLIAAGAIMTFAILLTVAFTMLMVLSESASGKAAKPGPATIVGPAERAPASGASASETPPAAATPIGRLFQGFKDGTVTDPSSPGWVQAELESYRDGGFLNATAMRAFTYLTMVVVSLFGFGWHVLAMFFIGAALVKVDVLSPNRRELRKRLMVVGLGVGLPLAVVVAAAPSVLGETAGLAIVSVVALPAATLMALGYFGGLFTLAESGRADWLTRPLAAAGRMALTVYLGETLIATFIMYHWGLGMFGEFGRAERLGIAAAIYVPLVVLSVLWMRRFRMGPVEWVWRSATYLRAPSLRRRGAA